MSEPSRSPAQRNTISHDAASLCLVSPVFALFVFVFVFAFRPGIGALASAILAILGILLGIEALKGIPRHGTTGLLGPAVTGLTINMLVAVVAIVGYLHDRDWAIKARKTQTALIRALRQLDRKPGGTEQDLRSLAKKLGDGKVLEFNDVTEKSQLAGRRDLVNEFKVTNDRVNESGVRMDQLYRAELTKQSLSHTDIESLTAQFSSPGSILSVAIRKQDLIVAGYTLELLKLMEEKWGSWKAIPGQPDILFERDTDRESYQNLRRNIDRAREVQRDLQRRLDRRL